MKLVFIKILTLLFASGRRSHIVLENIEFKTEVNVKSNIIEITKIVDNVVIPLDTIVAKDRELFALGRNEKFSVQILEQYLLIHLEKN